MSETKHTPGPWTFNQDNGRVSDHSDNPVAYISGRARQFGKERLTTACFNGHVIAAAPELLESLQRICAEAESWHTMHGHDRNSVQCDSICQLIPEMQRAIRKAKGE